MHFVEVSSEQVSELMLWVSELTPLYFGPYFGRLNLYSYSSILWVPELILCVSELIPLYFGCLNLYFGHQRTKHSGMTRESGNTEGPSILVWDLTF